MSDKIKLGVIGTGMAWERLHWPAVQRLSDKYEIACVCNKTIEKAKTFAASIGLPEKHVYADYRQMLAQEKMDAADLLVPISENFEVGRDVLAAGIPLIAEKPFASSPEAARELIALKNRKGLPVMVAENFRYSEEDQIIAELVKEDALGSVVTFLQCTGAGFEKEQAQDNFSAKEWRQHPIFAGGIFLDGGIHDMARMRFLFGEVANVQADGRLHNKEYCPYRSLSALLRFQNGITGQYLYFSADAELIKQPVGLRIYCEKGEIYLESKTCGVVRLFHASGLIEERSFTPEQGYYYEFLNFWEAFRNGGELVSTPEKELGDIELVYAILGSANDSSAVKQ